MDCSLLCYSTFFVASLSLFADVLSHVGKLSQIMQNSTLDFSVLQPVIDSCIHCVEDQKNTPGKYMSDLRDLIQHLDESGHHIHVEVNDRVKGMFDSQVKLPYLEALVKNLRDRFPCVDVISSFHIFNPAQLPSEESALYQYGVTELDCLLDHYSSSPLELDKSVTQDEWKEFKSFIFNSVDLKNGSVKELAKFLLCSSERQQIFPSLSKLLVCALLLPIATAYCEQALSAIRTELKLDNKTD